MHLKQQGMPFPAEFIVSIQSLLAEETEDFLSALTTDAPVSIRLNPKKSARNPMKFAQPTTPVPWSEYGYYLKNRPSFTFDPLFHAGYYYVQEAASMFVEYVVREFVKKPITCLDVCAAPGGKSIGLLSALPEGSFLVSNEIIHSRAHVLAETITKFGNPHAVVTNNAPKDFAAFPHFFEIILVDAPCSGEGMFRKDEVAVQEWSPANVQMCAARQRTILSDVWHALKPGGLLIYSTCTYNKAENEENVRWIADELGAEFVSVQVKTDWKISDTFDEETLGYRFFPHKTKGEGLFVAIVRKKAVQNNSVSRKHKKKASPFFKEISPYVHLLHNPIHFEFLETKNRIIALPKQHAETMLSLRERLKIVSFGIELGEKKGRDFIPAHALAMSPELNRDALYRYPLSYEEAIAYLRKETLTLADAPKGFILLTYENEPLGFVKNIGNRANNLYPNAWRIRSSYLPETIDFPFQQSIKPKK